MDSNVHFILTYKNVLKNCFGGYCTPLLCGTHFSLVKYLSGNYFHCNINFCGNKVVPFSQIQIAQKKNVP